VGRRDRQQSVPQGGRERSGASARHVSAGGAVAQGRRGTAGGDHRTRARPDKRPAGLPRLSRRGRALEADAGPPRPQAGGGRHCPELEYGPEARGPRAKVAWREVGSKTEVLRMKQWSVSLALLAVVVATIGCDQVAKHVATTHLAGGPPQSYLGGAFRLEYAENTGGFLSVGADLPLWARTAIFSVGNGLLLLGCVIAVFRH